MEMRNDWQSSLQKSVKNTFVGGGIKQKMPYRWYGGLSLISNLPLLDITTARARCSFISILDTKMPEKERREVDKMLRGLAPLHQRQLSVSSSNALERFAVMEVRSVGHSFSCNRAERSTTNREVEGCRREVFRCTLSALWGMVTHDSGRLRDPTLHGRLYIMCACPPCTPGFYSTAWFPRNHVCVCGTTNNQRGFVCASTTT